MAHWLLDRIIKAPFGVKELERLSERLARANGLHDGREIMPDGTLRWVDAGTNAIAHALTSAYLAHDYAGWLAKGLGDSLERYSPYWEGVHPRDTYKDLYNNSVGRSIATYVLANKLPRDEIQRLFLDAFSNGDLIATDDDQSVDPSFGGNPADFKPPLNKAWNGPSKNYSDYAATVRTIPTQPGVIPAPTIEMNAPAASDPSASTSIFPDPNWRSSNSVTNVAASPKNIATTAPIIEPNAAPDLDPRRPTFWDWIFLKAARPDQPFDMPQGEMLDPNQLRDWRP